jgi:plastocyanin
VDPGCRGGESIPVAANDGCGHRARELADTRDGHLILTQRFRGVPASLLALVVPIVAAVAVAITFGFTTPSVAPSANGTQIDIKNFAFSPSALHVKAATTITITNSDPTSHTVTADNHAFDTGNLSAGAHARITIRLPGTYHYHCGFHSFMHGVIEVS